MKQNGVIQRKLALLDGYVVRLERYLEGKSQEDFNEDDLLQAAVERVLQVSVEIVIDIAERLLSLQGAGPAASAAEAIQRLVDLGLLASVVPYQDMVRFRNRIVHEYTTTDPAIVYKIATESRQDFRRFRDEIDRIEST